VQKHSPNRSPGTLLTVSALYRERRYIGGHELIMREIIRWVVRNPEKAMAPHSSALAWKIPWMEEPGRLQSMGSLRVGHD